MVELKEISVAYGKSKVINSLSLNMEKGQLLSVIGVNGSGKSTLLKAAAGILPLQSGEIFIDSVKASDMSTRDRARKLTYLAQGKNVPDMTVSRMVLHGRFPHLSYPRRYTERDRRMVEDAMKKTGIHHLADRPVATLSGGMRQSAYIAMALVQATDYILLDEPTTYLDISCQTQLMRMLLELSHAGKGIVTVMHDLPLAFTCSDLVAVMDKGRLCMVDTPRRVCESGIVEEIFKTGLEYSKDSGSYQYRYTFGKELL